VLLAPLFGLGGLGLGVEFAAQAGRLTAAVEPRYAADISGASSTLIQVGGAIGVAAVGALYLAGTRGTGSPAIGPASVAAGAAGASVAAGAAHAFAVTTGVLAGVALLAVAAAWRASAPAPAAPAPAAPAPDVTARGNPLRPPATRNWLLVEDPLGEGTGAQVTEDHRAADEREQHAPQRHVPEFRGEHGPQPF
jgi:hypothetical protein